MKTIRYHFIPIKMAITKKRKKGREGGRMGGRKKVSIGEDVGNLESLFIISGNVKSCSHYGKQ